MNINHLREFAYLAETLSFAATARHFFLGASVVSKHIAAMEEDLQVKLFDRSARGVFLTEDGEAFYRDIRSVVDAYDRALSNLKARRANINLCLRVGYLRGAARPFLPTLVHHMEKNHSEVDLDLRCMEYGELIRAHRSHAVDVIFNMDFDPEALDACEFEQVYRDRLYVVVGKKHRLARKASGVTIDDLAGERFILPDERSYPGLAQRCEALAATSGDVSSIKRYQDIDTFCLHVAQGACVGFSSGHNFRQFEGRVVFLPLLGVDTSYTISAQWLKGCDARVVALAQEVARVCAASMENWSDGVSLPS